MKVLLKLQKEGTKKKPRETSHRESNIAVVFAQDKKKFREKGTLAISYTSVTVPNHSWSSLFPFFLSSFQLETLPGPLVSKWTNSANSAPALYLTVWQLHSRGQVTTDQEAKVPILESPPTHTPRPTNHKS